MTLSRISLKFLTPLLLLWGPLGSRVYQFPRHGQCSAIPQDARDAIVAKFPEWQIVQLDDLAPHHRKLWQQRFRDQCPGFTVGHFKSMQALSYASLLKKRDQSAEEEMLLLLTWSREGNYDLEIVMKPSMTTRSSVIYRTGPGIYYSAQRDHKIHIQFDGVINEDIEAGAILFYRENDRWKELITSE